MVNQAASTASFPVEMLRVVIVTIRKPDKDLTVTSNFRPISLLNVDVKIYAKVLANRLFTLLPTRVHHNQVGFIRDRQAPDGTRGLLNLFKHVDLSLECLL